MTATRMARTSDLIDGIERRIAPSEIRMPPRTHPIGEYTDVEAARIIALYKGAKMISEASLRSPARR